MPRLDPVAFGVDGDRLRHRHRAALFQHDVGGECVDHLRSGGATRRKHQKQNEAKAEKPSDHHTPRLRRPGRVR